MTALLLLAYLALPPVQLPQPCSTVRQIVGMLGEDSAMALAVQRGWTAAQIEEAKRRCLGRPRLAAPPTN